MRAHWRAGRRRGLALLAALSMVLVSAPGSGAAEEEGTKNLSTPVILVDDDAQSALFNEVTVPDKPTGDADYTKGGEDYYTSLSSDTYSSSIDTDFNADTWGADWVFEDTNAVGALAKWGDNLVSHMFSGGMPLRVEMNLYADEATAAAHDDMQGYTMVSLEGTRMNELFGTLGVAETIAPMVFTPKHNLTILKYDPATRWYSTQIYNGPMSVEVNGSGKLIYGFNWGAASGLSNPDNGNYRLIFTLGADSLVNFTGIMEGDDTEAPLHQPMLFGDKVSYLDIGIGTSPLVPALPFERVFQKSDFNKDGNSDVIGRSPSGDLWYYPGNGSGGWLTPVQIGRGWGSFTAIIAPGDFSGDGNMDLLVRNAAGELYMYPGNGAGRFYSPVLVGRGWGQFNAIVAPGDFNGDDHPDVLVRNAAGDLYMYPGNGAGRFYSPVLVGRGWGQFNAILGVGDFTGDGNRDIMVRNAAGYMSVYPGNGAGRVYSPILVGSGWGSFTALVAPWDFSGDTFVDVMARNSYGQLFLYRGNGASGWITPPLLIGQGWNIYNLIIA